MKKLILGVIIGVSFTAVIGASIENYVVNKNTADVQAYQNIRVFTDCKPVAEYEYIGTVKVTFASNGFYSELRDILIKNARKQYPNAEGIIINKDKADVIRFK